MRWILEATRRGVSLYCKQEGGVVSYNPKKKPAGLAQLPTSPDGRAAPGDGGRGQSGASAGQSHLCPALLRILDDLPAHHRPKMVRGDWAGSADGIMRARSARAPPSTCSSCACRRIVKRHIELVCSGLEGWRDAGQGWEGIDSTLALTGWEDTRRVVVLRRLCG
ncbi:MAG: hypothetical protein H6946_05565 [Thauera sp.]|uniref:hypothetical protein n=1 Tax=Thauera sp. TaxID=1905334 RepID=UPI002632FF26|nr:hypothetical protein [Thauera sp.]MCP5224596.1 hypothetical protein [Thauera sp.]